MVITNKKVLLAVSNGGHGVGTFNINNIEIEKIVKEKIQLFGNSEKTF